MGFHNLPSMRLYWSSDSVFHVDAIARVMTQKRFLKLLRYLHLNDNCKIPKRGEPNYDRLYKVRPMINYLRVKYHEIFSPSRFLSLGESMIGFKGRSSLKQYVPLKPTKRGFKVWVLACVMTAFVLWFDVYEGKSELRDKDATLGEYVVLGLIKLFEYLGYCIFFDRFFSSLPLFKRLTSKSIFGCATIQSDRKEFPNELLKKDKELNMGDSDFAADGEISVVKWKDRGKKYVKIISSMHDQEDFTEVERRNKRGEKVKVKCPRAVADYNLYMGGVDHFDHLLSSYSIAQKSRKWWIKIFYFLLDSVMVNSFILYRYIAKQNKQKVMKHLMIRRKLGAELIGNFTRKF
ncbi:hypothetical protein J6590_108659 [Homalodisca vitripennis]|nr:hypothetical protein J6590_108659 [Homalodisca vitripennis]